MTWNIEQARGYIGDINLAGTPRGIVQQDAAEEAGEVFNKAKDQAQVVGSGVFSFAVGVTPEVREAISDSALLAQLVANKRVDFETAPRDWFKQYAEVLQNVGWVVQDMHFQDYTARGTSAHVHEKILEVVTAALAPAAGALAIITASINALKAMKPESSWITIFERESRKARIARFQVGFVEQDENAQVFVSLLVCVITANDDLTQVLLFKFRDSHATFEATSGKVSVNRNALVDLGPMIRNKVKNFMADYLSSIQDI
jgi:hypothetical protein